MNRHHNHNTERDMLRAAEAMRRSQERLELQKERINRRFDRIQERLNKKYGEANDNQQRIIDAALELLREDGLNNLSLRKLADRLDIQAPALYWHFKNKEALVDYMAEAILQQEFKEIQPMKENQTWQDWLTEQMLRLRKSMLAYPDGARVVAGAHLYPAVTLGRLLEQVVVSLEDANISLKTARHIVMTVLSYTFGFVIEEQSSPSDEEIAVLRREGALASYPKLVQLMDEEHSSHQDRESDYLSGLQFIIVGAAK